MPQAEIRTMPCKWPEGCRCLSELSWLHDWLDEVEDAPEELFEPCYFQIFVTLACLKSRCPSEEVRLKAAIELMKPAYDRAKREWGGV
jgi:hypothetical protein